MSKLDKDTPYYVRDIVENRDSFIIHLYLTSSLNLAEDDSSESIRLSLFAWQR